MSTIPVGDIVLDYERTGEGPPLLAVMGMSGTTLHWGEPFLEYLRKHFDIIAYDHRGVGASTRLEGELTIRRLAEDAAGLLDALEIDRAHVLGISMGGMIAQELALAHPQLVESLTLGCTYCGGPGSSYSMAPRERLWGAMLSGDRERAIRAAFEINISAGAAAGDPELWEQFRSVIARRAVAVPVIMAQLAAVMQHDTSARLGGIRVPTLVIHGSADEMIPVDNGRLIASLIPDAELEILEGVGHLFFWEQPAVSAELIRIRAAVPA